MIALLLAGNLRGIRQAGLLFAAPTYLFLVAMFALIAVGLAGAASRGFHPLPTPPTPALEGVSLLLLLRLYLGIDGADGRRGHLQRGAGFQAGGLAQCPHDLDLDGQPAHRALCGDDRADSFRRRDSQSDPDCPLAARSSEFRHRRALWLHAGRHGADPSAGANTAYNDFPRVLYLLARAGYAPRMFLHIGDRLTFSNGILLLSVVAAVLYVVFRGQIPLYAVGVFLAFTLSQAGMVVHWWRRRGAFWRRSLFFNATGCLLSAIVFLTAGITKFTAGAWVSLLTILLFILAAEHIQHHYTRAAQALALRPETSEAPHTRSHPRQSGERTCRCGSARGRTEARRWRMGPK